MKQHLHDAILLVQQHHDFARQHNRQFRQPIHPYQARHEQQYLISR